MKHLNGRNQTPLEKKNPRNYQLQINQFLSKHTNHKEKLNTLNNNLSPLEINFDPSKSWPNKVWKRKIAQRNTNKPKGLNNNTNQPKKEEENKRVWTTGTIPTINQHFKQHRFFKFSYLAHFLLRNLSDL